MNQEILRYIQRLFAHHARKMRNMVARGVVNMVQDELKMQANQVQLLDGEVIEGAERAQQYGFTSHPLEGAECFVVFADGAREHPIILSVDDRRYRFKSHEPGEVRVYTDEGDYILLKRDNTIEIHTKHLVINAEEDVTTNTKKHTINCETHTVNASQRVGVITPALGVECDEEEGKTKATFRGDLEQDGYHTSTGDQVAGGVSQINHPHRDAGGTGPSGPPIKG